MTAAKCQATTRQGQPCQAYALTGSRYCFHHDPDVAAQRHRARSQGGRARHGRRLGPVGQVQTLPLETVTDVAALLRVAINDTLSLENSLQRSRTLGYLARNLLRVIETSELEQRIEELERCLKWREEPS